MKRRVIAAVAAILLAGVGAVVLLSYVGAADRRAMAGMETVNVLVVAGPIAEGTAVGDLGKLITRKTLPSKAVAKGALLNLEAINGQVAKTDLQPGEQLLASRFVDPKTLDAPDAVTIPKGMQQVTIMLEPQRVLGGVLSPGATVGLFISLPKEGALPARTQLLLNKVLVSKVQGGIPASPPEGEGDAKPTAAQATSVLVTLATSAHDAERVVFAAENAKIWLSLEPADADLSGTRIVTGKNVNK